MIYYTRIKTDLRHCIASIGIYIKLGIHRSYVVVQLFIKNIKVNSVSFITLNSLKFTFFIYYFRLFGSFHFFRIKSCFVLQKAFKKLLTITQIPFSLLVKSSVKPEPLIWTLAVHNILKAVSHIYLKSDIFSFYYTLTVSVFNYNFITFILLTDDLLCLIKRLK